MVYRTSFGCLIYDEFPLCNYGDFSEQFRMTGSIFLWQLICRAVLDGSCFMWTKRFTESFSRQ